MDRIKNQVQDNINEPRLNPIETYAYCNGLNNVKTNDEIDESLNRQEIKRLKKEKVQSLKQEISQLRKRAKVILMNDTDDVANCIHVSGLPADITIEELKLTFSKYGLIAQSLDDRDKIRIIGNDSAILVYHNSDSVPLAIEMLHEYNIRPGQSLSTIRVKKASRQESLHLSQPHNAMTAEQKVLMKRKMKDLQGDLNNWDAGSVPKSTVSQKYIAIRQRIFQKVCVVENMFRPAEMESDPTLEQDLKDDIRQECGICGIETDITKIVFYKMTGKVTIKFNKPELSLKCIEKFNGRFYDGLLIKAYVFDGRDL